MRGFMEAFYRGRDEALSRRGFEPPRPPFEAPERWPDEELAAEPPDNVGELQARIAECNEKREALNEATALIEELRGQVAAVTTALREREAECDVKKEALDELVPLVEQLQARNAELEAMPDAGGPCADVLRLPAISTKTVKVPSVKNLLLDRFHPEKHPKADDDAKQALKDATLKINAAYDAIKRGRRPLGG